jgi:IstB-like ATP binding protein
MTIVDAALHTSLRTLKLSGMLETLDARLVQAHAGELGHLDFLQVLCQDEITRRQTTAMARRLRRARFDQQTTMEEFDFAASPKLPAAQIRDLAALRWLHNGESILLHGPVGVGKSHVAQALGHLALRHGAEVRFYKTSRALLAHREVIEDQEGGPGEFGEALRPAAVGVAAGEVGHTRATSRRPLRTDLRTGPSRPITDHHLEPQPAGLVPTVPQPRSGRIPARPADQHQPPSLHERPQLPPEQAARARRPPGHHEREVKSPRASTRGIT